MQNDVPTLVASARTSIEVQEDALGHISPAITNGNNNPDTDLSTGNVDNANQTDQATFSSAALQALVNPGADEPVTFALFSFANDGTAVRDTAGTAITSKGGAVFYHKVDATHVVGFADSGPAGFDANDRVVFALTDNGNGTFTFNLNDQIDHNTADATGTGDARFWHST